MITAKMTYTSILLCRFFMRPSVLTRRSRCPPRVCSSNSIGRVPAFQAGCCEFETRLLLHLSAVWWLIGLPSGERPRIGRLRGRLVKCQQCRSRQGLFRPCWRHLYVGIAQRPDHLESAPLVHGFGHFGSYRNKPMACQEVRGFDSHSSLQHGFVHLGNSSLFSIVEGLPLTSQQSATQKRL